MDSKARSDISKSWLTSLADMSESQFRDSLDALILNVPSERRTSNETPPLDQMQKPPSYPIPSNVQLVVPTPFITTDQSQILLPASTVLNTNPLTSLQFLMPLPMPAPALSFTTTNSMPPPPPHKRDFCISEDEEEWYKRRQDRNSREQQRAQQITQQIATLRALLQSSNVPSRPDKYSTLQATDQYIRKLQTESSQLSSQHQSLLTTLQQTTEQINKPYSKLSPDDESSTEKDSRDFIGGIDYRWVFQACSAAMCLTSIDGRFMDCNKQFEETTQFDRATLLPSEQDPSVLQNMSIFNVLSKSSIEKVFCSMSKMLSFDNTDNDDSFVTSVRLGRSPNPKMNLRVTMARNDAGLPRVFSCVLTPVSKDHHHMNTMRTMKQPPIASG